jgi:hypothetical protein
VILIAVVCGIVWAIAFILVAAWLNHEWKYGVRGWEDTKGFHYGDEPIEAK